MKENNIIKRIWKNYSIEIFIGVITLFAGGIATYYFYMQDLVLFMTDQFAHLSFSRLMTDSLTPGISQIGFWPPLLHLLMSPFAALPLFYETGLAGAIILVPCLAVGTIILYRLTLLITDNKLLGVISSLSLLLNPYVLYYATTPMMEVLFLTSSLLVIYFFARWIRSQKLVDIILLSFFVMIATLSRFEGLIYLPILMFLIYLKMNLQNKPREQTRALIIIFCYLAILGLLFIVLYDLVYAGNPFQFMDLESSKWFAKGELQPNVYSFYRTTNLLLYASYYVLGKNIFLLSFPFAMVALYFSRKKFEISSILFLFSCSFIVVFLSIFRGSPSIMVPDLPPYSGFVNARYALSWVGFVIIAPIVAISSVASRFSSFSKRRTFLCATSGSLILMSIFNFYSTFFIYGLPAVKKDAVGLSLKKQLDNNVVTEYLKRNYDFGNILAIRFNADYIMQRSNVLLRNYIIEANSPMFDRAVSSPWLEARYVIMTDTSLGKSGIDPISNRWWGNTVFSEYYDLVAQDGYSYLYKINEERVFQDARNTNLSPEKIPSISSVSINGWNK